MALWNYPRRLEPLYERLGDQGPAGADGVDGVDGTDGVDGAPGAPGTIVQSGRVMTDAAGLGTWTYPTPYASNPRVVAVCEGNSTVYLTAQPGTTSVSFQTSAVSTWVQLFAKEA